MAALVDSGAEECLIDQNLVRQLNIPTVLLNQPLTAHSLNGLPLAQVTKQTMPLEIIVAGNHREKLAFCVLANSDPPLVLGLPWLRIHNPQLYWQTGEIISWCPSCHQSCLQSACQSANIKPPVGIETINLDSIPPQYYDLAPVFSKSRALSLPPHRPYDCAIELLKDATLPSSRLYNLSRPEQAAMESYIRESLDAGIIRSSSSPVGAEFFFIEKKDGSLRPCIDFRGLNAITVKNSYPLPLLNSAFTPLQGATIFTKLDLRSAYHLVRIREGDEWKTAFNTPLGHFEYLVMPFGLMPLLCFRT